MKSTLKTADVQIEAVLVLCPDCRVAIPSGANDFCWTVEDLRGAADLEPDITTAPMCSQCGAFLKVPYPKRLLLP